MPEDELPTAKDEEKEIIVAAETAPVPAQETPEAQAETPLPEPAPEPAPVPEIPVEVAPAPTPPPEPETPPVIEEPTQTPEPTPPIAPTPELAEPPKATVEDNPKEPVKAPEATPITQPAPESPAPEPLEPTPPSPLPPSPSEKGIPQKVLDLTPEELDAARLLWARQHIGEAQKQANRNRHARMLKRMAEIEKFVKANPGCTVHEVSLEVALAQKLTSGYLQKLVHEGRVTASGNTGSRRFS